MQPPVAERAAREPADAASARAQEEALRQVLTQLESLERCLQTEIGALASGDTEALIAAVDEKRRALAAIETASRSARLEVLLQGEPGARPATERRALPPSWPTVQARLERCRQLNEVAGAAIVAARRNGTFALRLLGHVEETICYGDAVRSTTRGGRDLGVC